MQYQIVKALHVISVISWMAGLFYLPRLFVYHVGVVNNVEQSKLFKVMERRLFRIIMNPASIATWFFGIWLIVLVPEYIGETWFMIKMCAVTILTITHHVFGRYLKSFESDRNINTERFYRLINEVPTIAMLVVVFMVVVKP